MNNIMKDISLYYDEGFNHNELFRYIACAKKTTVKNSMHVSVKT